MVDLPPDLKLYERWKAEWTPSISVLYEDDSRAGLARKNTVNRFSKRWAKDLTTMLGEKKVIVEARKGGLVAMEEYVKPPKGNFLEMRVRALALAPVKQKTLEENLVLVRVNDLSQKSELAVTIHKQYNSQVREYFSNYGHIFTLSFH